MTNTTPSQSVSVTIKHVEKYQFLVDFDEFGTLTTDEPKPLGDGSGPNPARLLLAAIGNCLCASLLFAIEKHAHQQLDVSAKMTGELSRVNGRWRVTQVNVVLSLSENGYDIAHFDKILAQFEDFCLVTQSVRQGIPVDVAIVDAQGTIIHNK